LIKFDAQKLSSLALKLKDEIVDAKEPLIMSLLTSVQDEIKQFHAHLKALSQGQQGNYLGQEDKKMLEYLRDKAGFKQKLQSQSNYIAQTDEYLKEINQKIVQKIQDFKY
jgi:hypothetical protein